MTLDADAAYQAHFTDEDAFKAIKEGMKDKAAGIYLEVAEAPAVHLPIALHAPDSIGGRDYAALVDDFKRHFEEVE